MIAREALAEAMPGLEAAGVQNAGRDARVLLAHAMGTTRGELALHLGDMIAPEVLAQFRSYIQARAMRQPVSQIIGGREFWGRWFAVTPDVLDPRPETETLIAAALEHSFARVLDLGLGTGAILLTLLSERTKATGVGVDLSAAALVVARGNARALGVEARACLIQSDWWTAVEGQFDLIVSNPPYIAAEEMAELSPEVRDWEPHLALTPGGDGLEPYRIITNSAVRHLMPGGRLLVEIGATQGTAVWALFAAAGFESIRILPDMAGHDRVVLGWRPDQKS